MKKLFSPLAFVAALAALLISTQPAPAQSATAFTYQGQLQSNGSPANGNYDIAFQLFNALTNGSAVGPSLTNSATGVSNGLFTVTLDFGPGIFTGSNYWLDIGVRPTGASNAFAELTPRQFLASTPQSVYALNSGTAANAASASNFSGAITGDVSGTQGATVVSSVGGQTATSIASGVIAANGATSSNIPNTIVARDGTGSFSAGSITLSSNLYLPFPATIYSGSHTVMMFEDPNYFAGDNAGYHATPNTWQAAFGDFALSAGSSWNGTVAVNGSGPGSSGPYNTAVGEFALNINGSGDDNTATGYAALAANTGGSDNTANGWAALENNMTGSNNTAIGSQALYVNVTGNSNVAIGFQALCSNTVSFNTANGAQALFNNTTGSENTANGYLAMFANLIGYQNAANGGEALYGNLDGYWNTADGVQSLYANAHGIGNTANGYQALYDNVTGFQNTADGLWSLQDNVTGVNNTATGYASLQSNVGGSNNVADGVHALSSTLAESGNIALGFYAGVGLLFGSSNIYIGNQGTGSEDFLGTENNTIRLGTQNNPSLSVNLANTYIGGIWDTTLTNSNQFVVVDSGGHLGTSTIVPGTGNGTVSTLMGMNHISIINPSGPTVTVTDDGTPSDAPGDLVSRDANGSFNANNIALGVAINCPSPLQTGVLNLPVTTATSGMITLNSSAPSTCGVPFLHGYGSDNFFGGLNAGNFTLTGIENVGIGSAALQSDTSGSYNVAYGYQALYNNTEGTSNTAIGWNTLYSTIGHHAGGTCNTAVGAGALSYDPTGNNNIAIGCGAGSALTSGDNNIYIGSTGQQGDTAVMRIGTGEAQTFIGGIFNAPPAGGTEVYVNNQGQLSTTTSSARFKRDIRDMDDASDVLLSLRPVAFKYKSELDPKGIPQFGLVAEEVNKVDPDLVVRDAKGQIDTVRYNAVNAMLLNEFLKEHKKVKEQDAEIQDLKKELAEQKTRTEERFSNLEKAVARLTNRSGKTLAVNNDIKESQ